MEDPGNHFVEVEYEKTKIKLHPISWYKYGIPTLRNGVLLLYRKECLARVEACPVYEINHVFSFKICQHVKRKKIPA